MKVIQSYIPHENPDGIIDRDFAYLMMLSLLSAKKYHENVTLYTNETQKQFLKEMGFEYDFETKTLADIREHIFVIPKLLSCQQQTEPFIHIDIDTILTKKIDNGNGIFFSHHDITSKERKYLSINQLSDFEFYREIINFCKTYLYFYYELGIDNFIPITDIKINQIPNMSIIGVNDFDLFKKSIENTLNLYQEKKNMFDHRDDTAMLLEQFYLPHNIQQIKPTNFDFITEHDPFDLSNDEFDLNIVEYIKNLPYFHIGGRRREDPFFKAVIIKMVIDEFGLKYISNIFNFYKSYFQENSIKNEPTKGELEYQKLTGEILFTDMGYKNLEYLL